MKTVCPGATLNSWEVISCLRRGSLQCLMPIPNLQKNCRSRPQPPPQARLQSDTTRMPSIQGHYLLCSQPGWRWGAYLKHCPWSLSGHLSSTFRPAGCCQAVDSRNEPCLNFSLVIKKHLPRLSPFVTARSIQGCLILVEAKSGLQGNVGNVVFQLFKLCSIGRPIRKRFNKYRHIY